MPLITMSEILHDADLYKYGVGAYNLLNMEAVKGAVRACEELRSPLIMQLAEVQLEGSPMNYMIPMMVHAAKEATVPVAVHFDHGVTFENIIKALKYGCTSVMFDGASLSFEENVKKTKEAVMIAHAMGATCEAELGVVGGAEAGGHHTAEELLTDVEQAAEFVERTGCDALAIAIGNAHGPYVKKPNLHFERLKKINEAVRVPLVLHGGSGISDEDFKKCVKLGIRKINVATSLQQNVSLKIKNMCRLCSINGVDFFEIAKKLEEGVFDEIAAHTHIFGSGGKANIGAASSEALINTIVHEVLKEMQLYLEGTEA